MDEEKFQRHLDNLKNESSTDARSVTEKLITIFRNVVSNPDENKFRRIRISNEAFQRTVWKYHSAQQLLFSAGWKQDAEFLVLPENHNISAALNILASNRILVPQKQSWEARHYEGMSEKQMREKQLKEEALQEKEKQLAEMKADKKERETMAELIKAEHRADRERLKLLKKFPASPGSE